MERSRAIVLYDGRCAFCQRSIAQLRRLDWLSQLTYRDARDSTELPDCKPPLDPARLLEEMHVVTPAGRVRHGFAAFRLLAWRLPLCWPLLPFLYVPGVPWLGQRVYLWVARNRFQLVPCHGGACTLPVLSTNPVKEGRSA